MSAAKITVGQVSFDRNPEGGYSHDAVKAVRQFLMQDYAPYVKMTQQGIIKSLALMVTYRGALSRKITHRELLQGIPGKRPGEYHVPPLNISEGCLRNNLKELEEVGLILRVRQRNSDAWTFYLLPGLFGSEGCVSTAFAVIADIVKRAGAAVSRAGIRKLAAKVAKGATTLVDIFEQFQTGGGTKSVPLRDTNLSPFPDGKDGKGANETQPSEEDDMLKQRRSERAQPALAQNVTSADEVTSAPHWKDRAVRHRRDVGWNEEHTPVLQAGIALASEAAQRRRDSYGADLAAPAPKARRAVTPPPVETPADVPNNLSGIVAKTLARSKQRQAARLSRKSVSVTDLEAQWLRKVFEVTGQQHPSFTMKERGMLKNVLKNVPINEPGATWPMVIDWLIEEWGYANGVARPYAFAHKDNIENIIQQFPRAYHLMRHAAEYVDAYILTFFGQGVHPRHIAAAEDLQDRFVKACGRTRAVATVGHDHLAPEHLTASELTHRVTDAAGRDIRADAALAERQEYRQEFQSRRVGTGAGAARRLRQQLDHERVAHRVRKGWEENAKSDEFADLFPTQDMTGYFEA